MRMVRRGALLLAAALLPGVACGDIYASRGPDGSVSFTDAPTEADFSIFIREAPPVLPWREAVEREAERYGLDPRLVRAVIYVESGENPRAVSPKGAQGLMQLMPGTAEELGVTNAFRPRENIQGGVGYLASMVERFDGRLDLALAAYNAGPGAVDKYGGIPPYPETQAYVRKVMDVYRRQGAVPGVDTRGPPGHNPRPKPERE